MGGRWGRVGTSGHRGALTPSQSVPNRPPRSAPQSNGGCGGASSWERHASPFLCAFAGSSSAAHPGDVSVARDSGLGARSFSPWLCRARATPGVPQIVKRVPSEMKVGGRVLCYKAHFSWRPQSAGRTPGPSCQQPSNRNPRVRCLADLLSLGWPSDSPLCPGVWGPRSFLLPLQASC